MRWGLVFSALRVYALSQKNWFLASFTFFWAILAMPIDYYVRRDTALPSAWLVWPNFAALGGFPP